MRRSARNMFRPPGSPFFPSAFAGVKLSGAVMQYAIDRTDSTRCRLSLAVTASEVKSFMDTALRELKKEAPKGFALAEAAEDDPFLRRIAERAAGRMASTFAGQALREAGLHPVARPWPAEGEAAKLPRRGREYTFAMLADVLPDIDFPEDFSAVRLEVREPDVSPREVFRAVERLMRPVVKLEEVTERRLPAVGDLAVVNVKGDIDGMPVPGLRRGEIVLALDDFPEETPAEPGKDIMLIVEKAVRGLRVGESGEGRLLCPEDYPDPSLRGRDIRLKITLNSLRRREVPPLTDETAARLGYPDARALKTKAHTMVMSRCVLARRRDASERLVRMLPGMTEVPVPESLRRMFLAEYMSDVRNFLQNSGEGTDASRVKGILAAVQEEGLRVAEENAKRHAYLLAYAYRTGISVPEKELEAQVRALAERAGKPVDEVRRNMEEDDMLDTLEERMMADRALEKIYAMVRKIVVDTAGNPVPAPGENERSRSG